MTAPLRVGSLRTPAAERRSEGVRACVCLCLALARSSASRGGAAESQQSPGLFSLSPALRFPPPPPAHPSQKNGPSRGLAQGNSRLFLFTRGPAGRAWGLGAGSLPTRERGPTPQDSPLRGSEGYFLGDVGPSAPFQVRNGREEASGNINLPTGREAPNLSGLPENPDQHVHHLLAPAAAILTVPPFPQVL